MTNSTTHVKRKRGRPPLSDAKKMQRSKAAENARIVYKALRAKIALLKANFKEQLKIAETEGYQKALERVVKIERKKMEVNYKMLALARAKVAKKRSKNIKRMLMSKGQLKPSQINIVKAKPGVRKRGRPTKVR